MVLVAAIAALTYLFSITSFFSAFWSPIEFWTNDVVDKTTIYLTCFGLAFIFAKHFFMVCYKWNNLYENDDDDNDINYNEDSFNEVKCIKNK